ncbi:Alpha/Beta hydrolase protein [Suillus fuscotomentosus]|uniref:GPI inositol-deacylase n=1 Tax=Suillus fuscotomentosus TaxID=1912939 RepID=A0AAD4HU16_9AGAM|nr:Alpha/Beta hydrolase protein [Suillus fuscotomentosus]KAG1908291.1 Alpha/Beta hydrolase protein [Suillus fuscotomentosus]
MYDLSSSPSTTVSSTLKTLTSRFEHPENSRNDEEIPASWSGMWGTRLTSTTTINGRVARGVHGRSFSASSASAPSSWALQHPVSMSISTNQKPPVVWWPLSSSARDMPLSSSVSTDGSPSSSRPPSPGMSLLNEALSDSILPTFPPRARLPQSFSPARLLSRPPPLLSNLLSTLPSVSVTSIPPHNQNGLPSSSADSVAHTDEPRISLNHSLPTHSSIDTLRSIHASTTPQIAPPPIPSKWWFQSDSDSGIKDNVGKLLNEEDQASSLNKIHQKYRSPKAPVVFCHGLLGFDTVTVGPSLAPLQVAHWRGIKEALEANGCEVLITRVPATSSPVERAKVLEKKISEVYPGRAVHLIGHSMGGLDCRYLTTHLTQRKFSVISITTIATPHRGSSFADHFMSLASQHLPSVLALLELLPNGGGDGKAFECLTVESMRRFNEETPDADGVRYFSWGACYEPGLIDTWKWPHSVILEKEGPNDGLVSVESAKWGTYLGTLSPVNHLDLVGWTNAARYTWASMWGKEILFKPASFYLGIADLLAGVEESEDDDATLENGVVEGHRERMQQNLLGSSPSPRSTSSPLLRMHPALGEMVSKAQEESMSLPQRTSQPAEGSRSATSPEALSSTKQRSLPPTPPHDETPPTPPTKSSTPPAHVEERD